MSSDINTCITCLKIQSTYTPPFYTNRNDQCRWITQQTKGGLATHVAQIHLCFPKYDHEEYLEALVLELGHNQMLLGIDWLNFQNPEVNWSILNLQFMHCPKCCSKNTSQLTIRWTSKAEKLPITPSKPEIDENGLSKGIKPDYIKPFQHLFEKNFNKLLICHEWDHEINLTDDALP